jgi:hypothetical protein
MSEMDFYFEEITEPVSGVVEDTTPYVRDDGKKMLPIRSAVYVNEPWLIEHGYKAVP